MSEVCGSNTPDKNISILSSKSKELMDGILNIITFQILLISAGMIISALLWIISDKFV